jgi:hypothetical protein
MAEPSMDSINSPVAPALKPKRRFVGASSRPNASRGGKAVPPRRVNQIPDEILNDKALNEAISGTFNPCCAFSRLSTETASPPLSLCRLARQLLVRDSQDCSCAQERQDPMCRSADARRSHDIWPHYRRYPGRIYVPRDAGGEVERDDSRAALVGGCDLWGLLY